MVKFVEVMHFADMSNVNVQESMSMPMISGNLYQCQCQYQCFLLGPIQYKCQCQYFFKPLINVNFIVNATIFTSMSNQCQCFAMFYESNPFRTMKFTLIQQLFLSYTLGIRYLGLNYFRILTNMQSFLSTVRH